MSGKGKSKVTQLPGTARGMEVTYPTVEEIVMKGGVSDARRKAFRSRSGGGGFGGTNVPQFDKARGKLRRKKPLE